MHRVVVGLVPEVADHAEVLPVGEVECGRQGQVVEKGSGGRELVGWHRERRLAEKLTERSAVATGVEVV